MTDKGTEFVLVSFIEFDKGFSAKPLMFGTKEQCEALCDKIPAVAYSGDKKVKAAWLSVRKSENWTSADPLSVKPVPIS